jgi:HSP20 family protein
MTLIKNNTEPRFDNLLNHFFSDEPLHWMNGRGRKTPEVNILENDDAYQLVVNAPGFEKDDFKLELNHNELIISADLKEKNEKVEEHFTLKEFSAESFSRHFNLPEGKIDEDMVKAEYNAGLLTVTLPKREEHKPKPRRLIDIN